MAWLSVAQGLPKPFSRVWLITDTGKQATGYVKSNGEWVISCARVAAENPVVVRWKE